MNRPPKPGPAFYAGATAEGKPFVHRTWGKERAQMTPDQCRELGRIAFETAEAAETDAMLLAFLAQGEPLTNLTERARILNLFRLHREEARSRGEAEYEPIAASAPDADSSTPPH